MTQYRPNAISLAIVHFKASPTIWQSSERIFFRLYEISTSVGKFDFTALVSQYNRRVWTILQLYYTLPFDQWLVKAGLQAKIAFVFV